MDEERDMEMIDYYIKIGAIALEGMDENGELVFSITDQAKEIAPELWEAHKAHVDNSLIDLYKRGLIHVEYDENLDASIIMSPEGKKIAREYGLIPPVGFEEGE